MSYRYSFEDLLALLHGRAPAKVDAVALHRRRVEHGHLSVGLKIHRLGGGSQFSTLVEGLGGAQKILDVNYYKHCHASLCLVLPPVGSAAQIELRRDDARRRAITATPCTARQYASRTKFLPRSVDPRPHRLAPFKAIDGQPANRMSRTIAWGGGHLPSLLTPAGTGGWWRGHSGNYLFRHSDLCTATNDVRLQRQTPTVSRPTPGMRRQTSACPDVGSHATVLGDARRAERLIEHDIAAFGAECHAHRVGENVDPVHHFVTRIDREFHFLGSHVVLLKV